MEIVSLIVIGVVVAVSQTIIANSVYNLKKSYKKLAEKLGEFII